MDLTCGNNWMPKATKSGAYGQDNIAKDNLLDCPLMDWQQSEVKLESGANANGPSVHTALPESAV